MQPMSSGHRLVQSFPEIAYNIRVDLIKSLSLTSPTDVQSEDDRLCTQFEEEIAIKSRLNILEVSLGR